MQNGHGVRFDKEDGSVADVILRGMEVMKIDMRGMEMNLFSWIPLHYHLQIGAHIST